MAIGNDNRSFTPLPGDQTNMISRNHAFQRQDEEMIRRIVREEILVREELGEMCHHNLIPRRLLDPNIPAQYQLRFMNKVTNTTFTTDLVRDENGHPIKVAIYDTYIGSIISPDNFLSSAKVKVIGLNAEFVENKGETLSRGEFNQSVLRERKGKGPILTGRSRIVQLENGVGTFENIVFNDNSSWTKSGFRLGVMVDGEEGYLNGERVLEGVSEPFRVKDRRVKGAQKPDVLKLKHSVQCIRKIGKSRASFLEKNNIKTVKDFLCRYDDNETELRNILCINSESDKEWESMVEHVTQCADEYKVSKCNVLNNSSQPCQPMEKNSSVYTEVGHCVVSWGSSKPNPSEKKEIIEAGMPICPSKNLSNEKPLFNEIGDEMQNSLFHEIGELVELTNDGGFFLDQYGLPFDMFHSEYTLDTILDDSCNPDIIMDGSGGSSGNYLSGRSFTGRKVGMEVPGLEDSQTAGYSGIF